MKPEYPLFIAGKPYYTQGKETIINPATGDGFASVACAQEKDIDAALSAAREAFDAGDWKNVSLQKRKESLLKIAQGILERAGELARIETFNTGKPIKESTFMDIPSAAKVFEYFANNLAALLQAREVSVSDATKGRLLYEPRGVVVLIVPWNYPLLIASWKMAQALAAGNTVIVKPSSLTPLSVLELGDIIQESGLPDGVVNIVNGSGSVIGECLCADERVDMISFTGSNAVGRKIIEYASRQVKKMIVELGGKSAAIILNDADLELAVNGSLCSIFLNQGQMCTAMSRIFVQEGVYEKFMDEFLARTQRIKLGDGLDYETQMGPLISKQQREQVLAFVEKAKREGATLLTGGKVPPGPHLQKGYFFEPAVFTDVTPGMSIFQEELFGPIVCISRFTDIQDAVAKANSSRYGLACSLWSQDISRAHDIARHIDAGIVWVNTYGMFHNELPYGGFKQSGFGKELGREGFLEYTRLKNIVTDITKDTKPIVNYWYGF
jgi:acyl-CoA reductase-like NAD-dependent aldehyde dehydrogenase